MLFDLDSYFLLKFFNFLQFKNNSFVPAILHVWYQRVENRALATYENDISLFPPSS
jgi:hypothetical protein